MNKRDVVMLVIGAALLRGGQWAMDNPDEAERILDLLGDVSLEVLKATAETLRDPEVRNLLQEVIAEAEEQRRRLS